MSQNTIITVILVIAALLMGVYFISSNKSKEISYIEEERTETEQPVPEREDASVSTDVPTSFDQPVLEETESTPVVEESMEEVATDTALQPVAEETPETPDQENTIEIIDNNMEYVVSIKGALDRFAKPFSILFKNIDGLVTEAKQDNLVDGVYKFESSEKFISLSINSEGYAPVLINSFKMSGKQVFADVELQPLAGVTGDIKDSNGKSIAGAVVKVKNDAGSRKAYADINGTYNVTDLKEGSYTLTVSHPEFDSTEKSVEVGKGEVKEVSVVLNKNGLIRSQIVNSEGKAEAGLSVKLMQGKSVVKEVSTNESGFFEFKNLNDGEYALVISSSKGTLNKTVEIKKNIEVNIKYQLEEAPSIKGILVDGEGKPLDGVKIFTFDDSEIIETISDKSGAFKLGLAKSAKYRILIASEDFEMVHHNKLFSPSSEKIILQAKAKKYLMGKVLSPNEVSINTRTNIILVNKSKNIRIPVMTFKSKGDSFSIPMSLLDYIDENDELQIEAISEDFGKGVSLSFKKSGLSDEKTILISLGE